MNPASMQAQPTQYAGMGQPASPGMGAPQPSSPAPGIPAPPPGTPQSNPYPPGVQPPQAPAQQQYAAQPQYATPQSQDLPKPVTVGEDNEPVSRFYALGILFGLVFGFFGFLALCIMDGMSSRRRKALTTGLVIGIVIDIVLFIILLIVFRVTAD